jgi:hypothetical protein
MTTPSTGMKAAIGLVLACALCALVVVVARSGFEQSGTSGKARLSDAGSTEHGEAKPAETLSRFERGQQRLQRLREAHQMRAGDNGSIQVHGGVGAAGATPPALAKRAERETS